MFRRTSTISRLFNNVADIYKAGLLCIEEGRVLLCRKKKRPASHLILPGGKLEGNETAEEAVRRECCEELGDVAITNLQHLGTYEAPAAGQENKTVKIDLFWGGLQGAPSAQAEIGELVWFDPSSDGGALAPSLRDVIFPDLRRRGIIS